MSTHILPPDHAERMGRVRLALDGLSVGDAFGSQFFIPGVRKFLFGPKREVPEGPWPYTDDTEMALGIAEVLDRHGSVEQDDLARVFAARYAIDSYRGYGPGMHRVLPAIGRGAPWREVSETAFGGQGSFGNGSAMRVAPVGAYFADDTDRAAEECRKSAEVTHAHPEGIAGAVAAGVAAATAWRLRHRTGDEAAGRELLDAVLALTPPGKTRDGLARAADLDMAVTPDEAAGELGNGTLVTCADTVPFCVWLSARHLANYVDALWNCVAVGGDIDTTSAIVGGIVVMATGPDGVPPEWVANREPLKFSAS